MQTDTAKQALIVYDLEVYQNFFMGVFFNLATNEYRTLHLGDELLHDIILNPDIRLIGWNNQGYDDILMKEIQNSMMPVSSGFFTGNQQPATELSIWHLSNEIITMGWDSIKVRELRWQEPVFKSYDLQSLLNPMPSLKKTEIRMHYHTVRDLPLPPDTHLNDEQKRIITDYCHDDVNATTHVFGHHALDHIELREFLADSFKLDKEKLSSLSEAKTAEFILSSMSLRKTKKKKWQIKEQLDKEIVNEVHLSSCIPPWVQFQTEPMQELLTELKALTLPVKPSGYVDGKQLKRVVTISDKEYQLGIGGLHSVDKAYQWQSPPGYTLKDADVTSYYPSILLRDKLFPRGYDNNWIDTYRHIYDTRLKAKTEGRKTEANALKIVLNATFGKLGSMFSTFYDPRLLIRVTLTGQLGLLMLIEGFYLQDIEVISANTDGIIVKLNQQDQHNFATECADWQHRTKFNLEYTNYKKYARRDVNNYTALTTNGKIKNKGIFAPPGIKHDIQAPVIQKIARNYLLYGTEPEDYLEDEMENLNIYDFLFSFTAVKGWVVTLNNEILSKSNRWYRSTRPINNQIGKQGGKLGNYIKIPNGENIILMNKVEVETLPDDLDIDYYIAKAEKLITTCTEKNNGETNNK